MGCPPNAHRLTISLFILVISTSSELRFFCAHGRRLADNSKIVTEEKKMLRAQIGSRPPRCNRRCVSCGNCEAIQVPTNPQVTSGTTNSAAGSVPVVAYSRGDGNTNYKPMSWKCKCGNLIFNP